MSVLLYSINIPANESTPLPDTYSPHGHVLCSSVQHYTPLPPLLLQVLERNMFQNSEATFVNSTLVGESQT